MNASADRATPEKASGADGAGGADWDRGIGVDAIRTKRDLWPKRREVF